MNTNVRFTKTNGQAAHSSANGRTVRITNIPQSNVLDLRAPRVVGPQEVKTEPLRVSEPEKIVTTTRRKSGNLLSGLWTRRPPEKKKEPPIPTALRKEAPPPPLVSARQPALAWLRGASGFAIACVMLVVPIVAASQLSRLSDVKGKVLGVATDAYDSFRNAGSAVGEADYGTAAQSFQTAQDKFQEAQNLLTASSSTLAEISAVIRPVASAQHIIASGSAASRAGQFLSEALSAVTGTSVGDVTFTRQLETFSERFALAEDSLKVAAAEIQQVHDEDVPEEFRGRIADAQRMLPVAALSLSTFQDAEKVFFSLLGVNEPTRILVLFQNNNEMRPTGGFIGSLALMDVDQGVIKNLEVPEGGSYDLAGQLTTNVIAPEPLHLVNPRWNIQDANWFPDFPTSAQKIIWFYERSGGATPDAVLAVTPEVLQGFLRLTGPIAMEGYGVTVTDQNFVRLAQQFADEAERTGESKPKKFIADLMPIVLNKTFTLPGDRFMDLSDTLLQFFATKDILLVFPQRPVKETVHRLGWDGSLLSSAHDYLDVIHTNIGGGKTDRFIENLLTLTTEIATDGTVTNRLEIVRSHHGIPTDPYEGVRNVDYVRVYVPEGSTLLSAEGFERIPSWRFQTPDPSSVFDEDLKKIEGANTTIDETSGTRITSEFGKTVFGNWLGVGAGETARAILTYRLPVRLGSYDSLSPVRSYSLLVQKQPGIEQTAFIQKMYTSDKEFIWKDSRMQQKDGYFLISEELSTDRFFGYIARKN